MTSSGMTAQFTFPADFNVAMHFVDRNVSEGFRQKTAIETTAGEQVTYDQLLERVNRFGNVLRKLDFRPEERVLLLLLDSPEFAYAFFGSIKAGAVPVPVNTLLKPHDYEFLLKDSRARALIVSEALVPQVRAIPRDRLPHLRHIVVAGHAEDGMHKLSELMAYVSSSFEAEPAGPDAPAFWL